MGALAQRKDVRSAQLQAQYAHRQAGRGGQLPPGAALPGMYMMPGQPGAPRAGGPYAQVPYPAGMQVRPPRWAGPPAGQQQQQQQQRGGGGGGAPGAGAAPGGYVLNNAAVVANPVPAAAAPVHEAHPSLADLSEKDRKQVLGEFLYPKIEVLLKSEPGGDPAETGKITGMLLESLDHGELVHLLESPAELKSRVAEAIQVLREHLAAASN